MCCTPDTPLELATLAYENGAFDQALAHCLCAIQQDPTAVAPLSFAGRLCLQLGKLDMATQHLQRAMSLDGSNPQHPFDLGNAHFGAGQYSQAIACYAKAEALGCSPAIAQKIHYLQGVIHQENANATHQPARKRQAILDALAHYQRALSIPGQNADTPDILRKQIQLYLQLQETSQAEDCARQLLFHCPGTLTSYLVLFRILLQQGKDAEALTLLDTTQFDDDPQAQTTLTFHRALVSLYRAQQSPQTAQCHYQTALDHLSQALKTPTLSPSTACELLVTQAEILHHLGQFPQAMDTAQGVLETYAQEECAAPFVDKARYLLLTEHLGQAHWTQAQDLAQQLQQSTHLPYRCHGYYHCAFAAKQQQGLTAEVLALYQEAIARYKGYLLSHPTERLSTVFRAKCYADIGEFQRCQQLCHTLPPALQAPVLAYLKGVMPLGD